MACLKLNSALTYKEATACDAIHGGQWRRSDRKLLGHDGPSQSLISRQCGGFEQAQNSPQHLHQGCTGRDAQKRGKGSFTDKFGPHLCKDVAILLGP